MNYLRKHISFVVQNICKYISKEIFMTNFIITFIIVKIIYAITGFNYNITKEIFSIKALIDLGLWFVVYYIVSLILKIYNQRNKDF